MLVQHPEAFERGARHRERPRPQRVMPMDAYLHADRLVVHVDMLDADPRTASVAVDGDVLTVTATRTSGSDRDARYARRLSLDGIVGRNRVRARVHDGVVTVMVDLREGDDRSARSPRR